VTITAGLCQALYSKLVLRTNNYRPADKGGALISKLGISALAGLWAIAFLSLLSTILWAIAIRSDRRSKAGKGKEREKDSGNRYQRASTFGEAPGIIRRATGKFLSSYGVSRYDDTSYETLRVGRERSRSREPPRSRAHSRDPSKERVAVSVSVEKTADTERNGRSPEKRYEPYRHHDTA
jgi:hypothetical protein